MKGLVLAAPSSGAGKTTLTLGLLRAFGQAGVAVRAAKSGPDYIDPAFHAAACGHDSVNLDAWAMPGAALRGLAAAQGGDLLLIEGAMGVLDAGRDGRGSVADLAGLLGAPVVLILDVAKTGQSAVLAAAGLRALRPDLVIAGAILNRVGSAAHAQMAAKPLEDAGFAVFGALPRAAELALPERHLGLVQAQETAHLDGFLNRAAAQVAEHIDLAALQAAAKPLEMAHAPRLLPPLGQHIAVAKDGAFTFAYPHLLADWRRQGAEISTFSPLADQAPNQDADAIYLPGGYPELYAGALAQAHGFRAAMHMAARNGVLIYGECGGYMVLGDGLIDGQGVRHEMLGLLPHSTSFAAPKRHLGYRRLTPLGGPWRMPLMGHEFHYASIIEERPAPRLFGAQDALGQTLGDMGMRVGTVSGSFAHVICAG
jgi:cobyrinic acid a,c-diamide synthase